MRPRKWLPSLAACLGLGVVAVSSPLVAQVTPERDSLLAEKEFYHNDLTIDAYWSRAAELPDALAGDLVAGLGRLGVHPENAFIDQRTGRWGTLIPTTPLVPGDGVGNRLTWAELGAATPSNDADLRSRVAEAFHRYLEDHESVLGISTDELARPGRFAINGDLVQIWVPRVVGGVPVRDSYLNAVVSHGNLILFGARNWNDVEVSLTPTVDVSEASQRAQQHLAGLTSIGFWRKPSLTLVPVSTDGYLPEIGLGGGLGYRLAWSIAPNVADEIGRWEALIDAHSGELLSFVDTISYQTQRKIVGGVLPVSNDGMPPDGVEHPGWPMPYADAFTLGGLDLFTDAGGNLPVCVDGAIGTRLSGRYMNMTDNCGEILEISTGDIDLGTSPGTDCQVAPGASPGNTRASRSGFYEINQIQAQARSHLADNTWLRQQLNANMNIVATCNATWDGTSVNFFRSGGGCANTGELAGVFDHEWGHGMDNFDVNPGISLPGEGIADIYAALRLQESCVGRGFFLSGGNCSGYGDPCLDCSGIRDIDYEQHVSMSPQDIEDEIDNCPFAGGQSPCNRQTHCAGQTYSQAVWDLANRTLPAPPFNFDSNTAFEVATRLTYLGAGPVGAWYNCNLATRTGDGCNADGGYLNYLAADDDNGNLLDGTPHMSALFAAFNIHSIACDSPVVNNADCAPDAAPSVTAIARDKGAELSWSPVPGATEYNVYRTDGVFECNFGKTIVGTTSDTSFVDGEGLLNDREYYYVVAAVGSGASCLGPMSDCTPVTPADGPNLAIDPTSSQVAINTGDGDDFIDNCEEGTLTFDVANNGVGTVSNVRIVGARSPSHPIVIDADFPVTIAPSLASCDATSGAIDFIANGLGFDEVIEIEVDVTADELDGLIRTETFTISGTESDFELFASKTFSFEDDTEGWVVQSGTFDRTNVGGGGNGTDFYLASSDNLEFQCDQVTSPILELSDDSELSLWNNFEIEGEFQPGLWYDRANIGVLEADGVRTPVNPDGGRLHDASGDNGTCDTTGQEGFAGAQTSWAVSTYSSDALMAADFAGDPVRLAVYYGTDPLEHGYGFWFDEVTVTNVRVQGADAQPNDCGLANPIVNLAGACPGAMTVTVSGLTPGGTVAVGLGRDGGGVILPSGPCAGTEIDLSAVFTWRSLTADGNGEVTFDANAPAGLCAGFVQAVDFSTCTLSDLAPVQ